MKCEYSPDQLIHARRMLGEERTELTRLRHELAVSDYKRLTIEMDIAALRGDQAAWAVAVVDRNRLDVDPAREPELIDYVSPLRCRCCLRLVGVSGTCKEAVR